MGRPPLSNRMTPHTFELLSVSAQREHSVAAVSFSCLPSSFRLFYPSSFGVRFAFRHFLLTHWWPAFSNAQFLRAHAAWGYAS